MRRSYIRPAKLTTDTARKTGTLIEGKNKMRLRNLRNGTLIVALLCALYGCKKAEETAPAATPSTPSTQESVAPTEAAPSDAATEETAPAADAAATDAAPAADAAATDAAPADAAPTAIISGDAEKGKQLYGQFCATCHGASGKGDGPAGGALNPPPRDHTDAAYMGALTDAHLYKVTAEGGMAVGKSPAMMGWIGSVGEQGVRDLVAYMRVLSGTPHK